MGDWYAVETVEHNIAVDANTVSTVVKFCPILQLTREDNMTIRLQWNTNRVVWTYRFLQPKPKHPGFWEAEGHHDGEIQYSVTTNWVTCQFPAGEIFGREGTANHYYSDSDSRLTDEMKEGPCPYHRTYNVGPSASSVRFFTGQNLN